MIKNIFLSSMLLLMLGQSTAFAAGGGVIVEFGV